MTSSIPLIRASAVVPIEYALRAAGRYSPEPFVLSGLPASPLTDPTRLVAFNGYFNLLDRLTKSEGPDFGCRTATPETLLLLGTPAAAARASRTVRDALMKFSRTLHFHASHVIVIVNMVPGGIEVSEAAPVPSSDTAQHAGHQQVASFISALGRIINGEPLPARITVSAHPELGIEHLRPHLGSDITISAKRHLTMFIPDAALDMVLPWEPIPFVPTGPSLASEQLATLTGSARALIEGMLRDGEVNLDRLALAAGRSRRTMQRLLQTENTSFAELVDSVRQQRALAELNGTGNKVSAIASGMGYSNTSSLTRAVRRWTDAPPSKLRRTG
jgi:AraC-like DNA-binding protein